MTTNFPMTAPHFSTFSAVDSAACSALVQYILNDYKGDYASSAYLEGLEEHPGEVLLGEAITDFRGDNDTDWSEVVPDFMFQIMGDFRDAWVAQLHDEDEIVRWGKKLADFTGQVVADSLMVSFAHTA